MSEKEKFEDPMSYSSDWRFGATNLVNSSSLGLLSIGNSIPADLLASSSSSSASMLDSFTPNFWDHSQNLGFSGINSSNTAGITKDHGTLEIGWNQTNSMLKRDASFLPNGQGVFPQTLSQFPTDSGFIERAARFSCFGGGNFGHVMNSYGMIPQSMAMYVARDGLKAATGGQSQETSDPSIVEAATKGVSPSVDQLATLKNDISESRAISRDEGKQALVRNANDSDRGESGDDDDDNDEGGSPKLEGTTSGEPSIKGLNSKKRKRSGQDADSDKVNLAQELHSDNQKGDQQPTSTTKPSGKNVKQGSQSSDPPKEEYIHVRARRGQATNSHSLAERVRREKISERMKFLQELVPGCSKVTGKAVMLDEIINYVQSLQRQVEFLSMKLATVNPRLDFNIDGLLAKDILHQRPGPSSALGFPLEMSMNFPPLHQSQPGLIQSVIPNMTNPSDILRRAIHSQLTPLSGGFKEPNQMPDMWEDELHNVIQMSFATTAPMSNQDVDGTAASNQMKVEL